MKATLLGLTILAATGAPLLVEGFPNPYQTTMDRQATHYCAFTNKAPGLPSLGGGRPVPNRAPIQTP